MLGVGRVCALTVTARDTVLGMPLWCLWHAHPMEWQSSGWGIPRNPAVFWVFQLMQYSQRNIGWEQTLWDSQPELPLEKG